MGSVSPLDEESGTDSWTDVSGAGLKGRFPAGLCAAPLGGEGPMHQEPSLLAWV